jgi:hypothetical protein
MADSKISALTTLDQATVDAAADFVPIVDTSTTTTKKITPDDLVLGAIDQSSVFDVVTNTLGADVALNNTGSYFTGPTCAQGTSGTWLATGTITLSDAAGAAAFNVKLWDGTTVISSARTQTYAALGVVTVTLTGVITNPVGNIRISAQDVTSTSGGIAFNNSGNSKDSILTVVRVSV